MRSPVSLASYAAAQVRVQARVDEAARSSAPAAVAPGQPQHMASVSRAAAQAAAAQVPNDDPYRTPSASPANMRIETGSEIGHFKLFWHRNRGCISSNALPRSRIGYHSYTPVPGEPDRPRSVSYTHLTLPTSFEV